MIDGATLVSEHAEGEKSSHQDELKHIDDEQLNEGQSLEKSNPTGSEMKEQQYINQNIQSVTIGKRSVSAPANNGEKSSIPPVSPDTRRKSSKTRGREHRKRHAKKRPPTTGSDILGGIPVPKEAGPRGGIRTQVHRYKDPFEEIVQPIFGKADSDSDGYLSTEEFWKIFRSQQLNLALTDEELGQLENEADLDKDGKISYEECIPVLRKVLMAVYQIQDKSPFEWIELATEDGSSLWFSKSTGETRYTPPEGYGTTHQPDLFEEVIYEVFLAADTRQIGYLSREQLIQLLQSESLALHLTEEEVIAITQELPGYAEGRVTYDEFVPVAKQLIMMSYQARDPSMSEWIQLNSSQFGLFWFNKRTGETRNQPPQELVMLQQQLQEQREEEIAFVHQTMEELEATKYVYEQEQIRSEALESDLAQMAQQLDETGRALDEANEQKAQYNAELNAKTAELAELNSLIQDLKVQITALSPLPDELQNVKLSLHVAEETISKRDVIIVEREESLQHLREQTSDLTARLEEANSLIASTSDALASVRNELNEERSKTKTLQKDLQFIPILQEELERAQDQLVKLQKSFEEKSTALSQTRKTMRNVRERNAELEKELGNMAELRDKLHQSRCETRTVKQLLAGKSTIMQERTRELQELKQRTLNMEEKDTRRARILAEVLERTARLYQQQMSMVPKHWQSQQEQQSFVTGHQKRESITRSSSCPSLVPDFTDAVQDGLVHNSLLGQQRTGHYTSRFMAPSSSKKLTKTTVPHLPPVDVAVRTSQKDPFKRVSSLDVKKMQAAGDAALHSDHRKQIPGLDPIKTEGTSHTMGGTSFKLSKHTLDWSNDNVVANQVNIGDRVLVQLKTSEFEFEPQTFSGQVKFIGNVDSEYVDHRIYAGIKLDEPVGQHDGVVKGKRYFTCPRRHGVMVRVQDIVAFLKPKSLVYKTVQRRRPQQTVL